MLQDLIAAIREAVREYRRRRWLRSTRESIQTPFD